MKRIDLTTVASVLLLTGFGMLVVYSTGGAVHLTRQLLFLPAALAALITCYFVPRRFIQGIAEPAYIFSLALLALVLVVGSGPGSNRWFLLGPVSFQPSELAKLTTVILLAKQLSSLRTVTFRPKSLFLPIAICLAPAVLILAEPDLSTTIILLAVLAAMLYWAGLPALHVLFLFTPLISFAAGFSLYSWIPYFLVFTLIVFRPAALGRALSALGVSLFFGLLSPLSLHALKGYQADRIRNFLAPWLDPHGVGWNAIQSRIAIGSGQLLGKGFMRGTQNRLGFLPNRHTDFVFSCVGEEFGLLGSAVVLALFALLISRFLFIARATRDRFDSLLCIGCAAIVACQVFINIGMLLGLLPITGISLPFISYGGSSLVLNFAIVGLLFNVAAKPE